MDRILFLDNSIKNDLYKPFEMGIVEGLKFVELVKGDGVPDRQSYFNSAGNYPKDSGWIIPLMRAYHNVRPL
jgi:hypothetical protein